MFHPGGASSLTLDKAAGLRRGLQQHHTYPVA